jgi:hypothetical protein
MNADYARSVLSYDSGTGKMVWKNRPECHFKSKRGFSIWNSRYAGKEITGLSKQGYFRVSIDYVRYLAHRVAWLIYYGEMPSGEIDHINGDRTDNRIENLRCVSSKGNARNMGLKSNNSSGVCGVCWCKRTGKWQASITVDYKTMFLGRFKSLKDAKSARASAEKKYNFHKNHGEKR